MGKRQNEKQIVAAWYGVGWAQGRPRRASLFDLAKD
jgi:hypothetical protein